MQQFKIQVQDSRVKSGEKWNDRTVVEAESANAAVRSYVVSARGKGKVKLGQCRSAKGKLFRAIPA
jgi:hypothetical protein